MNKKLFQIAAQACLDVYSENIDLGRGMQISCSDLWLPEGRHKLISIAGSNEPSDWVGNLSPVVKNGVKRYAALSARTLWEAYGSVGYTDIPLVVCGHSRGAAVAIAYKRLFGAQHCICFSPARSLALWAPREMDDTTMFVDPDDPVSRFYHWFRHPRCQVYRAADDHVFPSIKDHGMGNWVKYTETMQEIDKNR